MSCCCPGDLDSKAGAEEEQISSLSDRYQEPYFHPLVMTGTAESTQLPHSAELRSQSRVGKQMF